VLLGCVVVLALGVGASSASATVPGPFFKNGAGVLGEGQLVVLKVKQKTVHSSLWAPEELLSAPLIECRAASGEVKAFNEYVKGVLKEGRLKESKVVLEDCELPGASPQCEINGKENGEASIPFEHVLGRLGYKPGATEKEREEGKGVEELFYPEAGKYYSTLKFSGRCPIAPDKTGDLKGGVIWTGSPVNKLAASLVMGTRTMGHGQAELTEINFPEFGETLKGEGSLEAPGVGIIFTLETELGLTPPAGVELGVFT
jgi:hypothetical protein